MQSLATQNVLPLHTDKIHIKRGQPTGFIPASGLLQMLEFLGLEFTKTFILSSHLEDSVTQKYRHHTMSFYELALTNETTTYQVLHEIMFLIC